MDEAGMPAALKSVIAGLVSGIEPTDDLGREHSRNALSWLAGTDDIFRRVKPLTPSPHLVSYFLLVGWPAGSVLLCDHRLSGLWLPAGGHVEPGEHPLGTVRREAAEELGIAAEPDAAFGGKPFFLTMTETAGPPASRHVDVSLWFALAGRAGQPLHPDQREFARVRWWTAAELRRAGGRVRPGGRHCRAAPRQRSRPTAWPRSAPRSHQNRHQTPQDKASSRRHQGTARRSSAR